MKNNGESQQLLNSLWKKKCFMITRMEYDMLYCIWSYLNSILLIIL